MLRLASASYCAPARRPAGAPSACGRSARRARRGGPARLVLGLPRGLLGLQLALGPIQPRAARTGSASSPELVTARVAEPLVLGRVDRVGLLQDPLHLRADRLIGPVRPDPALAASLVPSTATVPTLTIPAFAHIASTCTNNPANGSAYRCRNRRSWCDPAPGWPRSP